MLYALHRKEGRGRNVCPNVAFVERERLVPGVAALSVPPPIEDFVRFYITTSKGFVHDQATVDSVSIWLEWLFAALNRVARTATIGYERSESYLPVGQEEGLIVRKHKAKQLFTQQTLTTILRVTWADEDPVFIDKRSTAQFMFFVFDLD
jgi:hypothetical protein